MYSANASGDSCAGGGAVYVCTAQQIFYFDYLSLSWRKRINWSEWADSYQDEILRWQLQLSWLTLAWWLKASPGWRWGRGSTSVQTRNQVRFQFHSVQVVLAFGKLVRWEVGGWEWDGNSCCRYRCGVVEEDWHGDGQQREEEGGGEEEGRCLKGRVVFYERWHSLNLHFHRNSTAQHTQTKSSWVCSQKGMEDQFQFQSQALSKDKIEVTNRLYLTKACLWQLTVSQIV